MKLFHFIFVLYISFLAACPCYDDCSADEGELAVAAEQGEHEDEGPCTPFCAMNCNTTHPFFNNVKVELPTNPLVTFSKKIFVYSRSFPQQLVSPIWQPPRLA